MFAGLDHLPVFGDGHYDYIKALGAIFLSPAPKPEILAAAVRIIDKKYLKPIIASQFPVAFKGILCY